MRSRVHVDARALALLPALLSRDLSGARGPVWCFSIISDDLVNETKQQTGWAHLTQPLFALLGTNASH